MHKNIFLPDIQHKRRSHLSHPRGFILYIVFLLSFFFFLRYSEQSPSILGYATDININQLLSDTNQYRKKIGVNELKIDEKLTKAAQAKAKDMFEDDYWAHIAPDGTKPWDFIKAYDYSYIYAGENLAVDFSSSDDVVDAWYESPSHRENLLSENYTDVGFAIVNGELQGRKTTLVVQMFGKPRETSAFLSDEGSESLVDTKGFELAQKEIKNQQTVNAPAITIEEKLIESSIEKDTLKGSVLNSNDVFSVSKYITIILGLFVTAVLAVDGYYVRKLGVLRITGHTILHIAILVLVLLAIWYTNVGLVL